MPLFSLNGNIRSIVAAVVQATAPQRKGVSIVVNGLFSASKGDMIDPLLDARPTARQALQVIDVVIPINSAINAAAIDLGTGRLVGIQMPAAWTAADLTFQAGFEAATLVDLFDGTSDTTERKIEAGLGRFIALNPNDWAGVQFLKIRSGTVALPVNQTAARTIKLIVQR